MKTIPKQYIKLKNSVLRAIVEDHSQDLSFLDFTTLRITMTPGIFIITMQLEKMCKYHVCDVKNLEMAFEI